MKIFAYRIEQKGPRTFPELIDRIHRKPLQDRFGERGIRLEERRNYRGFLLVDFARVRRGHGPGRLARNTPFKGIRLRGGQSFAEDTGMAFDPKTGYAAIQYNHFGPRALAIEEYLWAEDLTFGGQRSRRAGETDEDRFGFKFGALLKKDAYERLRKFQIVHDIDFTVAIPGIDKDDFKAGRSLDSVLDAPLPEGVETLAMRISAAPYGGTLARGGAMRYVDNLRRLGAALQSAVVRGKQTEEDRFDKVDLVEERVSKTVEMPLDSERRYSRADRWKALADTLQNWLSTKTLKTSVQ
jgi:hypothetical protein